MRISIGNEQFFGCEDSICRPILNDISVTFTILMQYLGLINRAFFFYILLTIKLSEIIAMPALPFPASIWTKIPCLASIEFPQKCISKFVTLVLPCVVITFYHLPSKRGPLYDDISIFKKNFNSLTFVFVPIPLLDGYISKAKE